MSNEDSSKTTKSGTAAATDKPVWICDICKKRKFSTFEEACAHEQICEDVPSPTLEEGSGSAAVNEVGTPTAEDGGETTISTADAGGAVNSKNNTAANTTESPTALSLTPTQQQHHQQLRQHQPHPGYMSQPTGHQPMFFPPPQGYASAGPGAGGTPGYYPPHPPHYNYPPYRMPQQYDGMMAAFSEDIIIGAFVETPTAGTTATVIPENENEGGADVSLKQEKQSNIRTVKEENKTTEKEDVNKNASSQEKPEQIRTWVCRYCAHITPQTLSTTACYTSASSAPSREFITEHLMTCVGNPSRNIPQQQGYYPYPPQGYNYGYGYGGYGPNTSAPFYPFSTGAALASSVPAIMPLSNEEAVGMISRGAGEDGQSSFDGLPGSDSDLCGTTLYPEDSSTTGKKQARKRKTDSPSFYSNTPDSSIAPIEINPDDILIDVTDRYLLTDYFLFMMQQLQICHFTERDRKTRGGKRENISVGFAGLQCRHCAGNSFARKFFWSDADRLANSFSEIPSHVLMCRMTPPEVKRTLGMLKSRHPADLQKMPRGSQKKFIRRMWRRLHGIPELENADEEDDKPSTINRRKKRSRSSTGGSGSNKNQVKKASTLMVAEHLTSTVQEVEGGGEVAKV